jgi:hypothetical protein
MRKIPQPLMVLLVIVIGVGLFFVLEEPHSVCQSQLEVIKQNQKGKLFSFKDKKGNHAPSYQQQHEICRVGNSAGACFEYFQILRRLYHELEYATNQCIVEYMEVKEIKKALHEGLMLMVEIAWGETPPQETTEKVGWFESPDLLLFCQLKALYLRANGQDAWNAWAESMFGKLPGEAPIYDKGLCVNCETRKMASQTLTREEAWVRSLFSISCEKFL